MPSATATAVALAPPDPGAGIPGTVGALPSAVCVHQEPGSRPENAPSSMPAHGSVPKSAGIRKLPPGDPAFAWSVSEAALTGEDAEPASITAPWARTEPWPTPGPATARAGEYAGPVNSRPPVATAKARLRLAKSYMGTSK
jgi:hypothetical protein